VEEYLSRLTEIPVRTERLPTGAGPDGPAAAPVFGLGGGVAAILAELVGMLERLAQKQAPAAIDLRSLPMSPQDRIELKRALGDGEVRATVEADAVSTVHETAISGVWWVEHRNRHGELTAELLEVTRVPEILARAPDEIAIGANVLRDQVTRAVRAQARSEDQ
jgi:hydrogenase-1 operon protein HyaF